MQGALVLAKSQHIRAPGKKHQSRTALRSSAGHQQDAGREAQEGERSVLHKQLIRTPSSLTKAHRYIHSPTLSPRSKPWGSGALEPQCWSPLALNTLALIQLALTPSPCQALGDAYSFTPGFLNLALHFGLNNTLLQRADLRIAGFLSASLGSTHQMPVASQPPGCNNQKCL